MTLHKLRQIKAGRWKLCRKTDRVSGCKSYLPLGEQKSRPAQLKQVRLVLRIATTTVKG